jgi:heme A synthase
MFGLVILAIVSIVQADPSTDPRLATGAVTDPEASDRITRQAAAHARNLSSSINSWVATVPKDVRSSRLDPDARARAAGLRLAFLLHVVGPMIPFFFACLALGFARRQAASRGAAWSSALFVTLGLYLVAVVIILTLMYILSALPLWCVYVPYILLGLAAYLYIGNLPCRL